MTTLDHADEVRGFAATPATLFPGLSLLPTLESHESPEEAYRQTLVLLSRRPRPVGIYISTANSMPVWEAMRERRLLVKVQVVTTDLFAAIVPLIESGHILATLYQRPYAQARVAFQGRAKGSTGKERNQRCSRTFRRCGRRAKCHVS